MRRTSVVLVISGLIFLGCAKETPLQPFSNASAFRRAPAASDTGGGGGGGNQFHAVTNGSFGSLNWTFGASDSLGGGGGSGFGFLSVSQGGSPGHPQVYLNYVVMQCDLYGCNPIAGGYGSIPAGDLSGGGSQMRLSTNTSADPDFFVFAGTGGTVSVEWKANGFFTARSTGVSDQVYGSFAQHLQGTSSFVSATATGSVVGTSISPNQSASIGQNQNVSIYITTH